MLSAYNLMFPYFTQEEVARFRQICSLQNVSLNRALCSTKIDVLWEPFLNRLHKLDPYVSIKPPYNGRQGPWRYERFVLGYEKISSKQAHEIAYFKEQHPHLAQEFLDTIDITGLSLLQQLEKTHVALEKVKMALSKAQAQAPGAGAALPETEVKSLLFQMPLITQRPEESKDFTLPEPLKIDEELLSELEKLKL
ncbi:MAG: hypothetical protein JSR17_10255 [Proteobacteria bacterium]|nr:hypothetical protein [Pseudomonadota bacterium]